MKALARVSALAVTLFALNALGQTNAPAWPATPLSLNQALDHALSQSPAILKGKQDIEEAYGVALQLRAAALPKVIGVGSARQLDENGIESVNFGGSTVQFQNDTQWGANIEVSQPVFTAGKITSSLRSAKLTKEAALAQFQALVADTLLDVKINYDNALLAAEQIKTQEGSVQLLTRELEDQKRRYEAGSVPRFNVLRAEVELANAKPRLFRARNAFRVAKNTLATRLGWNVPDTAADDIPLTLADSLKAEPFEIQLGAAIARALQQRPEISVLRTQEKLRLEEVKRARADYFPQLSANAGWRWQNRTFTDNVEDSVDGWVVGGQVNWSIWDFGLTQGRVKAARARQSRSRLETDDNLRQIELEVRTAHSTFNEAKEVLESQQKVIEQAEEALRLANARADAGTGTQLDVLTAQTALTDSRTTYSLALRDYAVARARLERAMGEGTTVKVAN